jgi:hypothetical protein
MKKQQIYILILLILAMSAISGCRLIGNKSQNIEAKQTAKSPSESETNRRAMEINNLEPPKVKIDEVKRVSRDIIDTNKK